MANRQLFLKAGTTSQLVGRIVGAKLEPIGIPAYLLAVLTHIRDLEPVSPSRVSAASGMPPTTLRDNIQRLVDRGLVRRVRNPDDGRSYLLVPTPRGIEVTRAAGDALHAAYLELERQLPRPLHEVEAVLDVLNEAMSAVAGQDDQAKG
ncbi:MarR family winged helix-turn-helix transcriptional regulator [Gaiella sp.]|uniref:MarR family winged helix-turn-helix transcriptional regulator n=1 Tax=Gaiella sp. TaxID=2663207 RepID=UPI0032651A5A